MPARKWIVAESEVSGMTLVTTPRHHVQWVVTEHGAVDLSPLSDLERARALMGIAHPDFREPLTAALAALG